MSFFAELKRRNVVKVTIAYIVMAWLVVQVTDVALNNVEAPGWVFHVIMLLLGIGLPFVVFFSCSHMGKDFKISDVGREQNVARLIKEQPEEALAMFSRDFGDSHFSA